MKLIFSKIITEGSHMVVVPRAELGDAEKALEMVTVDLGRSKFR